MKNETKVFSDYRTYRSDILRRAIEYLEKELRYTSELMQENDYINKDYTITVSIIDENELEKSQPEVQGKDS